jgi:hypothetical protein
MSKKQIIALADKLIEIRENTVWNAPTFQQFEATVGKLAEFCADQSPRFNREWWLAYIAGECGPNGGKVRS